METLSKVLPTEAKKQKWRGFGHNESQLQIILKYGKWRFC